MFLVSVIAYLIFKTGAYQEHIFWIFLFSETFFDFFEELGKQGKGEYSDIIRITGFLLFIVSIVLSFFFAGWKIAILIFVTFFLLGKNVNFFIVNRIFTTLKEKPY